MNAGSALSEPGWTGVPSWHPAAPQAQSVSAATRAQGANRGPFMTFALGAMVMPAAQVLRPEWNTACDLAVLHGLATPPACTPVQRTATVGCTGLSSCAETARATFQLVTQMSPYRLGAQAVRVVRDGGNPIYWLSSL